MPPRARRWNKLIFDGRLPTIPIKWASRLTKTAGLVRDTGAPHPERNAEKWWVSGSGTNQALHVWL